MKKIYLALMIIGLFNNTFAQSVEYNRTLQITSPHKNTEWGIASGRTQKEIKFNIQNPPKYGSVWFTLIDTTTNNIIPLGKGKGSRIRQGENTFQVEIRETNGFKFNDRKKKYKISVALFDISYDQNPQATSSCTPSNYPLFNNHCASGNQVEAQLVLHQESELFSIQKNIRNSNVPEKKSIISFLNPLQGTVWNMEGRKDQFNQYLKPLKFNIKGSPKNAQVFISLVEVNSNKIVPINNNGKGVIRRVHEGLNTIDIPIKKSDDIPFKDLRIEYKISVALFSIAASTRSSCLSDNYPYFNQKNCPYKSQTMAHFISNTESQPFFIVDTIVNKESNLVDNPGEFSPPSNNTIKKIFNQKNKRVFKRTSRYSSKVKYLFGKKLKIRYNTRKKNKPVFKKTSKNLSKTRYFFNKKLKPQRNTRKKNKSYSSSLKERIKQLRKRNRLSFKQEKLSLNKTSLRSRLFKILRKNR